MTTGKNKEQFEKWYLVVYKKYCKKGYKRDVGNQHIFNSFFNKPFNEQIGVYLAYYDSLGYSIETMTTIDRETKSIFYEAEIYDNEMNQSKELWNKYETRNEAYKEAFKQADLLVNK